MCDARDALPADGALRRRDAQRRQAAALAAAAQPVARESDAERPAQAPVSDAHAPSQSSGVCSMDDAEPLRMRLPMQAPEPEADGAQATDGSADAAAAPDEPERAAAASGEEPGIADIAVAPEEPVGCGQLLSASSQDGTALPLTA